MESIFLKRSEGIDDIKEEIQDIENYLEYAESLNYCYDRVGANISNIVCSRFEQNKIKSKDFHLFTDKCFETDDSIMTLAVADEL